MNNELEILVSANLDQNKSIAAINKSIEKLEKKIQKLKLTATFDNSKSKAEIQKQIETLNKQKRKLYVDLQLRKDTLKKQYQELQKESNFTLSVNTSNAEKNIRNVSNTITGVTNESVTLGLALKNVFSNAGLVMSAQNALQMIRKAANEATQAVKEYDRYATNISVITGGSRESSNKLLGDIAEKSLKFKIDVSDLESAEETLLRTGKSIDETNKYLENTIYLSKLGFQDMDTSATQLVTIGNAYGFTADEMASVVDKFTKLDTSANVTAGKLAEGVAKSAQNAKLAGFNIDQLAASIAGLKDVVSGGESQVANSLNMIFSRLQNVKLGKYVIETEDGSEDITEALNDTEKILNTVNIKLRDSKNEFRDISSLFTELSDNWNKFNNVQKSAISTTIAGARQRNTFIALIENWNKIQELTDVSLNSMGTAVEKYDNYLQSIEAKSATLNTSMKELWNNLLPTEFVGDVTDATTSVIQFTDKYSILNTMLKSAVFYGLSKGLILAKDGFTGMVTSVKNVSAAMNLATQSGAMTSQRFADLQNMTKVLTDSQLKLVLSNSNLSKSEMIKLLSVDDVTTAEAEQRLATLGITQANQQATTATFSLSGAFKTLWSVLASNPVLTLTMAFTGLVTIYQTVQRKNKEMQESAVEAINKYNEQEKSLEDLRQKYIDICDSENSTAKKTEELNEWKKTLIETYGLEKEAIEQVNLAREDGLKLIDDEIIKNQINSAETWLTDNKKAYEDAKKNLLGANNSTETAVIPKANIVMNIEKGALDDYSENFDDIMKQLTIKNPTKDNPLAQIKIQGSNVLQQYENLSKILNDITSIEVTKGLNKSEQELYDALLRKQKEYKKIVTDDMRDIVENGKKYTSMIQLYNFETDSGINFENVTTGTYKEFRDKFLESLGYAYKKDSEDFSLDIEKILLDMLPDLENSYRGINIEDIIDTSNADETSENIGKVTSSLDDLTDKYNELSKSAESYTKAQKTLTDALKEQEEHGQLSADSIRSLSEAGYSQALAVDKETGAVTLNMEAYNRLNEQKKQKLKLDYEQQNTELKAKINEEGSAISSLTREYEALAKTNKEANAERLKQIEIEIAAHSQNKAKLQDLIDKNNANNTSLDAPTFEKSDNKDLWKEEAEKKFADLEHLYAMDKISYASYLNQMDQLNQHYYGNNEKYLDDFRKYEEKVYQGRKKLAEDLLAEEEKTKKAYCDNRISELETQVTVTTKDSIDKDGNKLNASEKYDYLRTIYDEILAEIERRENEIVQAGVEGHETELAELAKKYEEYANKKSDIFKDEIQYEMDYLSELEKKYNDFMNKRIKRYEDERDAVKDRYDSEIKALDKTIDGLKDKNNEAKTALDLKKAEQNLEKATQRTRMVYGSDGRIIYRQDDDAIAEAQQKVDDLKLDMIVSNLEKQKEALEEQKATEVDKYDDMITALNEQKDTQEKYFQTLIEILSNYSNPKASENIKSVWDRIFADKENVTVKDTTANVKGTDVDTSPAVFGEIDSDKVNQTLDKVNKLDLEKILKSVGFDESAAKNLIFDKLSQTFFPNINPMTSIISQPDTRWITQLPRKEINNNSQPVNMTFGDINVNNPVGDAKQLAQAVKGEIFREAMMEIPNVAMKQIHSNLK